MSAARTSYQVRIEKPTSGPDFSECIDTILRASVVRDGVREAKLHPDTVELGSFPVFVVVEVCLSKGSSLVLAQIAFAENFRKRAYISRISSTQEFAVASLLSTLGCI
jgi:hypothetical protein